MTEVGECESRIIKHKDIIYDGSFTTNVNLQESRREACLMKHKKPLYIEGNDSLFESVKLNCYNRYPVSNNNYK
jgi:hypothetical protein